MLVFLAVLAIVRWQFFTSVTSLTDQDGLKACAASAIAIIERDIVTTVGT